MMMMMMMRMMMMMMLMMMMMKPVMVLSVSLGAMLIHLSQVIHDALLLPVTMVMVAAMPACEKVIKRAQREVTPPPGFLAPDNRRQCTATSRTCQVQAGHTLPARRSG